MNFCLKCLQTAADLNLCGEKSEIVTVRRRITVECWLGFLMRVDRGTQKQLVLVHVPATSETPVNQKNIPAAIRVVETH